MADRHAVEYRTIHDDWRRPGTLGRIEAWTGPGDMYLVPCSCAGDLPQLYVVVPEIAPMLGPRY